MYALIHLIHGKKQVIETLGRVADFCPICHEIRCFDFKRISWTKHFYFKAYGKRKPIADRIDCTCCGLWLVGHASRYANIEKMHVFQNNADWLMEKTFPTLPEFYAQRLAFEKTLKKNPRDILPESRAKHMLEMFLLSNPQWEATFKGRGITRFDKRSATVAAYMLGFLGISLAAAYYLPDKSPAQACAEVAAILTLLSMAIFGLTQFYTVPGRKLRGQLLPRLARGLRPFNPLEAEIDALLAKCKKLGLFIARKASSASVMKELQKPADIS